MQERPLAGLDGERDADRLEQSLEHALGGEEVAGHVGGQVMALGDGHGAAGEPSPPGESSGPAIRYTRADSKYEAPGRP